MCIGTRLGCTGENGLGELGQGRWGSLFRWNEIMDLSAFFQEA